MIERLRSRPAPFRPVISLHAAMLDAKLFGPTFAAESFWTWRTIAKLVDGTALAEPREIDLFQRATGRMRLPDKPVRRFHILAGRRAGKDRFLSAIAVWRAALAADWRRHLSAGESAVVTLLGADRRQAGILRRYCDGLIAAPLIAREVMRRSDDVVEFRNGAVLEIATNDVRLVRGRSAIAVLGSECCYWRTDETASSSDEEVVGAAEPSLAMCPDGGLLVLGSSVYRTRGYMYRRYRELHGNDGDEDISWLLTSADMNGRLPPEVVSRALAKDAPKASAEFLSIWRSDLETYVDRALIEAAIDQGVTVRPPRRNVRYTSFCDPSGGQRDSFTAAICHAEGDAAVLDCIVEIKAPFSPVAATAHVSAVLASYGLHETVGDKYAAGFVVDAFAKHGVIYRHSEHDRSELYLNALPLFTSGRVLLLDHRRLVGQFAALERKTSSVGRDRVNHPEYGGGADDLCNAAAGALVLTASKKAPMKIGAEVLAKARQWNHPMLQARRASRRNPQAFFR